MEFALACTSSVHKSLAYWVHSAASLRSGDDVRAPALPHPASLRATRADSSDTRPQDGRDSIRRPAGIPQSLRPGDSMTAALRPTEKQWQHRLGPAFLPAATP